jgi:hypothetical protein
VVGSLAGLGLAAGLAAGAVGLAPSAGAVTPTKTVDVYFPIAHNAVCGGGFVGTVVWSDGSSYDCSTNVLSIAV